MPKSPLIYILALIFALVTTPTFSQSNSYVISYVDHKGIIHYYKPLLDRAYRKIGIKPTFVLINDQRALRLLNQGKLDADTAKSLESIHAYPDITYLPTPISKIEVFFICQLNITCDESIIYDHNKVLGVIGADDFYSELLAKATITKLELTSFETLFKLFDQQKVDVAIIVLDEYTRPRLAAYPNHYKLYERIGYHLINKKHQHRIAELEQAIKEVLREGNFVLE